MCLVGEEILGYRVLAMLKVYMACGCAYIGLDSLYIEI